jgi:hypothetical protein
MAITQSALAHAIARDLVRVAPAEAGIQRIWVWSQHGYVDPERDYVELTIFNNPIDDEAQHRLDLAISDLDKRYAEVLITVYLFGPYAEARRAPGQWVHPEAEEIDLGAE